MKKIHIKILFIVSMLIVTADWWFNRGLSGDIMSVIGSLNLLAAYWGFVIFSFLYILSSRHQIFEKQIGYDKLLYFHKIAGIWATVFLIIHPVFVIIPRLADSSGIPMFSSAYVGYAGFLLMVLITFTAKYFKTLKLEYETWNRLHFLSYPLYFFLLYHVFFHADQGSASFYLWIVFVAAVFFLTAFRITQIIRIRKNSLEVTEVIRHNHNINTLRIAGKHSDFLPGQFFYLQKQNFHHILDKNPFTISSSPHETLIEITAKSLGDCSGEFSNVEPGRKVFLDGPYGVFSHLLHPEKNIVFIAGGIGITPFISMLKYMDHFGTDKEKVTLFWGMVHEQEFILRDLLETLEAKHDWLTLVPVMSDQPDWPGHQGFIDLALIREFVPDYQKALYMICGPEPMKNALEASLLEQGVSGKHIIYEYFEF